MRSKYPVVDLGERSRIQRVQLTRAVRNRTTGVLQDLVDYGATVVVEHDLDMISNADCIIGMGPGGGESGGRIVACGTPAHVRQSPESVTARHL